MKKCSILSLYLLLLFDVCHPSFSQKVAETSWGNGVESFEIFIKVRKGSSDSTKVCGYLAFACIRWNQEFWLDPISLLS